MEQLNQQQREQIVNDDAQFRKYVMETLGELKADLKSLVGNGQPGRVGKIEVHQEKQDTKIDRLEWYAAVAIGAGLFGSYLLNWGWKIGSALLH